ncbi:MAG: DUF493 domain-containing protein [Azospira oryzae]|jgi:hypothetical protein|nr:DUF493 domain-containing protein [Cytophaga sp.]PZR41150.1 MAG: DUF493 domain-containing protein [Azospira oryzae]
MNEEQIKSFKEKLDQAHAWPVLYMFKFIVPKGKEEDMRKLFAHHPPTEKASQNGNFISFTAQMMMHSSDAVIEVYQQASAIEGIIAL